MAMVSHFLKGKRGGTPTKSPYGLKYIGLTNYYVQISPFLAVSLEILGPTNY